MFSDGRAGLFVAFVARSGDRLYCLQVSLDGAVEGSPFLVSRPTALMRAATTVGIGAGTGQGQSDKRKSQ